MASLAGTYDEIDNSIDATLDSVGIDPDDVEVEISCTNPSGVNCSNSAGSYDANATSGSTVTVTVTYTHDWITPVGAICGLVGGACVGDAIVLERTSQMVRE